MRKYQTTQLMEWVKILKCTFTGNDLRELTTSEISSLNELSNTQALWHVNGTLVDYPIHTALVSSDGSYVYPIIKGIVILLSDLAIVKDQHKVLGESLIADKKLVQNFYNDRGWSKEDEGDYEDAIIFEDLRPMSAEYLKDCHKRVKRYLNDSGTYMLDAGSGALQYTDYLQYSDNYTYRICADLSFQGLQECKRKLGEKAICLLCDLTKLPIKDGIADGFVSLNVVYHIPKDEQINAISEMYRVLAKNGKGVVVYDWYKHSILMNVTLLPFRAFEFFRHRIKALFAKAAGQSKPQKMLYFHAHPYEYFKANMPMPFKLAVWRVVSVPFMKVYLHPFLFGKQLLKLIWNWEEKYPEYTGKNGEYPLFYFEK